MHGDVLTKHIAIAAGQTSGLVAIFQILGRFANHTSGKEMVSFANACPAGEKNVGANNAAGADFNPFFDYGIGANPNR